MPPGMVSSFNPRFLWQDDIAHVTRDAVLLGREQAARSDQ